MQEFSWSCWPETGMTAGDVAVVQDTLSQALPGIVRQDVLVKSSSAPLQVLVSWVIQNTPPALYGAVVGQIVGAACSAARRIKSSPAAATVSVDIGAATIDMNDASAGMRSSQMAGAAFELAYQCVRRRVNTFGEPMKDLLNTGPSVAAGHSWPAPVERVLMAWSEASQEWSVVQVGPAGRGGLYVPRQRKT